MSRSIRGERLTDVKRMKKLCGRVAHQQALTRSNKRLHALLDLSDNQHNQRVCIMFNIIYKLISNEAFIACLILLTYTCSFIYLFSHTS